MEIIDNGYFENRIEENIAKIPGEAKRDFEKIKKIFPLDKINIVGGFVRDSVLQVLYGYKFPANDLDILVEEFNFDKKINVFDNASKNRFGSLKLKYNNFSIDVLVLERVYFLKEKQDSEKNLENFLKGSDLTTSSIAYNLGGQKIYDGYATTDILNKEVNVTDNDYMKIGPTISRLILHADKMNFKIGKQGVNYIKENYSSEIDNEILDWLQYKEISHLFSFVKSKINKIIL